MQANKVKQEKLKIERSTPHWRSWKLSPSYLHFLLVSPVFSNSSKLCGCGGALQLEDNTDHWFCPLTLHNDLCISQTYCHDNSLYCFHATALLVTLLIVKGTSWETVNFYIFCCNFFFNGCKFCFFFFFYNERVHYLLLFRNICVLQFKCMLNLWKGLQCH